MKYELEYAEAKSNKEKFIKLVKKRYPHLGPTTPAKRFYDIRSKYSRPKKKSKAEKEVVKVPMDIIKENNIPILIETAEKKKPNQFKLLLIGDMKQFGKILSRNYLHQYGFTNEEINWIMENEKNDEMV